MCRGLGLEHRRSTWRVTPHTGWQKCLVFEERVSERELEKYVQVPAHVYHGMQKGRHWNLANKNWTE